MYRVIFHNQGKIYELYARNVCQSDMFAFLEVENLVFGDSSKLVVNPGEEALKSQFEGVRPIPVSYTHLTLPTIYSV